MAWQSDSSDATSKWMSELIVGSFDKTRPKSSIRSNRTSMDTWVLPSSRKVMYPKAEVSASLLLSDDSRMNFKNPPVLK